MRYLFPFVIVFLFGQLSAQTQVGSTIKSDTQGDYSGFSVSLSSDGKRVAVGSWLYSDVSSNLIETGRARIFEENNNVWTQIGDDIYGTNYSLAAEVSLSANGKRVAHGAFEDDRKGLNAGSATVYEEKNGVWTIIGSPLYGFISGDLYGTSVALSADGNRLIVGATQMNLYGPSTNNGYIKVFEESNGIWNQLGSDFIGEVPGSHLGSSCAISADGKTIAFPSPDSTIFDQIKVFTENNGAWSQTGNTIIGEADGAYIGSIALSADGKRLVFGAASSDKYGQNKGVVEIFDLINNIWTPVGNEIPGEKINEGAGNRVALSNDGKRLVFGATGHDENGVNSGEARIYYESNGTWIKAGSDIQGEKQSDLMGMGVAISPDGNRFAAGAIAHSDTGYVKVFESPLVGNENIRLDEIIDIQVEPNPTSGTIWLEINDLNNTSIEIEITNSIGQKLIQHSLSNEGDHFLKRYDLGNYANGIYLLTITSGNKVATRKIVLCQSP